MPQLMKNFRAHSRSGRSWAVGLCRPPCGYRHSFPAAVIVFLTSRSPQCRPRRQLYVPAWGPKATCIPSMWDPLPPCLPFVIQLQWRPIQKAPTELLRLAEWQLLGTRVTRGWQLVRAGHRTWDNTSLCVRGRDSFSMWGLSDFILRLHRTVSELAPWPFLSLPPRPGFWERKGQNLCKSSWAQRTGRTCSLGCFMGKEGR